MTLKLTDKVYLIYPYYDNPVMLEKQVENWNNYRGDLRKNIQVILVDDCSQKYPAAPIMEHCKAPKKVFRVTENIPWGQHHARNVGARVVKGGQSWMFMSDMDIMLTPEEAFNLFEMDLHPNRYHTFERRFYGEVRPPKYHLNTFLVKHHHFWAINGYDVDFCGAYGGDGPFLRQLNARCPQLHHGHMSEHLKADTEISGKIVTLWGYEPEIIKDANTTEFTRKEGIFRERYEEILAKKKASGDMRSKNPIRWPYERVL